MNDFDNIVKRMSVTRLEPGDYTGEDGLLYCGKCRTPKQFRMDKLLSEGRPLPCPCRCEQEGMINLCNKTPKKLGTKSYGNLTCRMDNDPIQRRPPKSLSARSIHVGIYILPAQ